MPRWPLFLCVLPLVFGTAAFAAPKTRAAPSTLAAPKTPAAPPPAQETSLWQHNGSVVTLTTQGSSIEIRYKEPRPGMVEVGAAAGALLFRGKIERGEYVGTAYLFVRRCGQFPYEVSGPVAETSDRFVLKGRAPRVGDNCRIKARYADTLEFDLISPAAAPNSAAAPAKAESAAPAPAPATAPGATTQPPPKPQDAAPAAGAVSSPANPATAAAPPPSLADLAAEVERNRATLERTKREADAAKAAELALRRELAEADASHKATNDRVQQLAADLKAVRYDNAQARIELYIVLAMTLLVLGAAAAAAAFLFLKQRKGSIGLLQMLKKPWDVPVVAPPEARIPKVHPPPDAADSSSAAKRYAPQPDRRLRVFFRTGASDNRDVYAGR
jgi:hypothetical protein